jgi:hypothetical protein
MVWMLTAMHPFFISGVEIKHNAKEATIEISALTYTDDLDTMILKEINPLAFYMPADNSGKIHVVMDKSINDATELRTRIRNLSPAGANAIVVSGTTVTAATSFTVA